jgi:hypothetical protein
MGNADQSLRKTGTEPMSKADFFHMAGISPELEEFVTDFIQRPEIFSSLPESRRREIEAQMDAVLSRIALDSGSTSHSA